MEFNKLANSFLVENVQYKPINASDEFIIWFADLDSQIEKFKSLVDKHDLSYETAHVASAEDLKEMGMPITGNAHWYTSPSRTDFTQLALIPYASTVSH